MVEFFGKFFGRRLAIGEGSCMLHTFCYDAMQRNYLQILKNGWEMATIDKDTLNKLLGLRLRMLRCEPQVVQRQRRQNERIVQIRELNLMAFPLFFRFFLFQPGSPPTGIQNPYKYTKLYALLLLKANKCHCFVACLKSYFSLCRSCHSFES